MTERKKERKKERRRGVFVNIRRTVRRYSRYLALVGVPGFANFTEALLWPEAANSTYLA